MITYKKLLLIDHRGYELEKLKINLDNIGKFAFTEILRIQDYFLLEKELDGFSLIIMDPLFPNLKDGLYLLDAIKNNSKLSATPIIILSSEDILHDTYKLLHEYEIKDYIQKPYTFDRLTTSIKNVLPEDAPLFYSFENTAIVSMPAEDFIRQHLQISARAEKELSILFITPNRIRIASKGRSEFFQNLFEKIYSVVMQQCKMITRSTDILLLINQSDILLLLHATPSSGIPPVEDKIRKSVNAGLAEFQVDFDSLFDMSAVTFPEDGKDIATLMHLAVKKNSQKLALDRIVSVNKQKFDQARASYKKYSH